MKVEGNEKYHACPRVLASVVFRYSSIPPLFRYLTVFPWCSGYSAGVPQSAVPCSGGVPLFRHCPVFPRVFRVPSFRVPVFLVV